MSQRPVLRACLVLPATSPEWAVVISAAAQRANLPLIRPDEGDVPPESGDFVVIVATATEDVGFSPTDWAVVEAGSLDAGFENAVEASRRCALAYDGVPENAAVIKADFVNGTGQRLFDRLDLRGADTGDLNPGWRDGIGWPVFDNGPPAIGDEFVLPISIFSLDTRHAQIGRPSTDIELVGRARYLVFGPYYWLPMGVWNICLTFAVDAEGGTRGFRLEWGGLEEFDHFNFSPKGAGRYAVSMDHEFKTAASVELRMVLAEAALAGRFVLESIVLKRTG